MYKLYVQVRLIALILFIIITNYYFHEQSLLFGNEGVLFCNTNFANFKNTLLIKTQA